MKHYFEEKMKLMRLIVGDSKGEEYRHIVYAEELWWTEHEIKEKLIKEIVVSSFYIKEAEIQKFKRAGTWLKLEWVNDTKETFLALDFKDEFDLDTSKKTPEGTRVVLSRKIKNMITLNDEERETHEKKVKKLSTPYHVTFFQKGYMSECVKETYEKIRESVTVPMVPNMREPLNLAGHLHEDIEQAKEILRMLDGEIIPVSSRKHEIKKETLERAKYFLNIYEHWTVEVVEAMKKSGYIKPINVFVTQADAKPHHVVINHEFVRNLISKLTANGTLSFTENPEYHEVSDYNEYTSKNALFMTSRLEAIAEPLHEDGDIREDTLHAIENNFNRNFFEPQKNAIEACVKSLEKQHLASIVGEMGTGSVKRLAINAA